MPRRGGRALYERILIGLFDSKYQQGDEEIPFTGDELRATARTLGVTPPRNWSDTLYAYRFRKDFPAQIASKAPAGKEWTIFLAGKSKYRFGAVKVAKFTPQRGRRAVKIPLSVPTLVLQTTLSDEQSLLAKIRYNRLIDIFLGATAYSLQNHLRTTAPDIGQTEVDEIYVAVDASGTQYVVPVQAKGGADKLGVVQVVQDLAVCRQKWPDLEPRPVGAQFDGDKVVLFEFVEDAASGEIQVVNEKHFLLVNADQISASDLQAYRRLASPVRP